MEGLLTLKEVASRLQVSEQRVYQLDLELEPIFRQRGTKMKARYYRPEVVERLRVRRESREVKGKTMSKGFNLSIEGRVYVDLEALWPDGDAPENPTVGDVVELISKEGGFIQALEAWGYMDEFSLVISGNGGARATK